MAKFKGADKHLKRLKAMGPRVEREASKLIYALADMHVAEASHLITQGAVSGKNHQPSAPGEAPNEDTGALRASGHVERTGTLTANSVFDAPHAVPLELGTSDMAERPYARPAARTVRRKAEPLVEKAVKRIVGGGTL
jgi:hypothetical protein